VKALHFEMLLHNEMVQSLQIYSIPDISRVTVTPIRSASSNISSHPVVAVTNAIGTEIQTMIEK